MNPAVLRNIVRFVGIFLFQVLILKRIDLSIGHFDYLHLIIYPYAVFLLPIQTSRPLVLLIAFTYGIGIDMFYNSPGVHTSAMVFTAYLRSFILKMLEPYEGYNLTDSPTLATMGFAWLVSYLSILMVVHLLFYFSVEAFSMVYFFDIFLNTLFSFFPSILLILLLQLLFKPKY